MKNLLFSFILILYGIHVTAQEVEVNISADRPGMATGVDVMSQGKVQGEMGFEFGWGNENSITLPTTLFRYGILSFAEVRLQYDGTLAKETNILTDNTWKYHVEPICIGTKIRLYNGKKWIPEISFLANVTIPYTKECRDNQNVASQFYLLFHNQMNNRLSVDYNVGEEWSGTGDNPSTFLAICLGLSLVENVGAFVESYNYIQEQDGRTDFSPNVDFGFSYTPTNRIQFDLYSGFNCKEPKSNSYIGFGFAWLIN